MFVEQVYLSCLSQSSYFVADKESGNAAVIDPRRDTEVYLELAQKHGVQIKHIFLTHIHADFVAGHLELQEQTGAKIYLGKSVCASFPFIPVGDGTSISLGRSRLEIIETPGHTPESISIMAFEADKGDTPSAVFTGDTLFVGDVGRPDLLVSSGISSEQLAGMLFDSLQQLLQLPDDTIVYPAHGPGSMCGKHLGPETFSIIGDQRRLNYALQFQSKEAFIESICSRLPELPPYFSHDALLNTKQHPLLDDVVRVAMVRVEPAELNRAHEQQIQLLDVRGAEQFARGHVDGAVNVSLKGSFATWVGTVMDLEQPMYVLCNTGQEREALLRLGRIGLEARGYFNYTDKSDGETEELQLRKYNRLSIQELQEEITAHSDVIVLDVRGNEEWLAGHIDGSINIPVSQLSKSLERVPRQGNVVVHCQGGYRSSIAMSLLLNAGYQNVREFPGGFAAWDKASRQQCSAAV